MIFDIFTLHTNLFESFTTESLIARGIDKNIIQIRRHNIREFGLGDYRAVDDRPFGGGHGMVLRCEPIYKALEAEGYVSSLFQSAQTHPKPHHRILPNNSIFEQGISSGQLNTRQVTIMLTPRGYPLTQPTCEWLSSNFDAIGLVCGRYEGFDARVSECVDLELSLGDFVLNGGEVAAMALIEGVSRLIPNFISKGQTVLHDSYSSGLNRYPEHEEYILGKKTVHRKSTVHIPDQTQNVLFDSTAWIQQVLPFIEHPQYTRPEQWQGWQVPEVLLNGDHKLIDKWRQGGWSTQS